MWKQSFRARRPSKPASWRCENEALMRDFPPKVKVEDVKTKLSCETPLTNWKLKMWKTKLLSETSLQKWKLKMWKRSFCERLASKTNNLKLSKWSLNCQLQCGDDPRPFRAPPGPSRNRRADKLPHPSSEARFDLQNTTFRASAISQKCISCETSLKKWKLKMCKQSFRARRPSKPASWRCENDALMRDFPPKVKVEDVKTKLLCEEAFVRDFPQKVKVEDVKTKLL